MAEVSDFLGKQGLLIRVASTSIRICRRSVPHGIAATAPLLNPLESACMNAHQTGILALLPASELKVVLHPVSEGAGVITWHCLERS